MIHRTSFKHTLMLSTRENFSRAFSEYGVVFGQAQAREDKDPIELALDNLVQAGRNLGCDAIIAMRLLSYQGVTGPIAVAYGTAIKWLEPKSGELPPSKKI
jgi:uncharacterized protein YbjQ (UPF0145 family)